MARGLDQMGNDFATVKFRVHYRILFVVFASFVIRGYLGRLDDNSGNGSFETIKDTIVAVGLLAFSCTTFFAQMKIDSHGIHHVFGIVKLDGRVIGRDYLKTWDTFGIVIFNRKPFLAISLHERDLPFIWWFMISGIEDMLSIVAKYGMDSVVREKDREYLRQLARSE
jgi:hypothetical protein